MFPFQQPTIPTVPPQHWYSSLTHFFLCSFLRGSYGTVKKCSHKTKGNVYAAKIIKTANHNIRKTVLREIEIMRSLGPHNKVVELVDAYQTPFEIVMVLEL